MPNAKEVFVKTPLGWAKVYPGDAQPPTDPPPVFRANAAVGGVETIITVGDKRYKLHVFTSPGAFIVTASYNPFEVFLIGGGGSASSPHPNTASGAPGNMGHSGQAYEGPIAIPEGTHQVTIGPGGPGVNTDNGAGQYQPGDGNAGGPSLLGSVISAAGGGGGTGWAGNGSGGPEPHPSSITGTEVQYGTHGLPGGGGVQGDPRAITTHEPGSSGTVIIRYEIGAA